MRRVLFFVVDLGAGLVLAGAVAPLLLVVLPRALAGRALLVVTAVACIAAASAIRRRAARR